MFSWTRPSCFSWSSLLSLFGSLLLSLGNAVGHVSVFLLKCAWCSLHIPSSSHHCTVKINPFKMGLRMFVVLKCRLFLHLHCFVHTAFLKSQFAHYPSMYAEFLHTGFFSPSLKSVCGKCFEVPVTWCPHASCFPLCAPRRSR